MLAAGDLALDPARRRVTRAGAEVTLTSREYALLEYLMRRPGEVVSKTELLDHVWDASLETAPNVVEVYVGLPAPQARPRRGWRPCAAPATGWRAGLAAG